LNEWEFTLTSPAKKYLKRLTPDNQRRIIGALKALCMDPTSVDFKPLKGRSESRLRVGDYRILIRVESENKKFVVIQIGPRGDVYK
jgi:mRNA interferase RelE/StbE